MTLPRLLRAACLLLGVTCRTGAAQHQTGAPAGIPAPPVPASPGKGLQGGETASQSAVFRIRVLDGRNALPIRNAHVKLWYDEPAGPGYELATDAFGYGAMPAPIGEPVRVLAGVTDYTDCRKPMRDDPPVGYSLQSIKTSGLAAQNGCGHLAVHTSPGELVLFARPARWYEGLNRNAGN